MIVSKPKCRFCKNLNPWVDRELDEVMMCFEIGVVDKGGKYDKQKH